MIRKASFRALRVSVLTLLALCASSAVACADDFALLAHHVVVDVLGVKNGDVVLITTATQNMDLVDDIQLELRKAGAWGIPFIQSDRFNRAYYDQVPAALDTQAPANALRLSTIVTAQINIDWESDPHLFQDVAPARVSALNASFAGVTGYFVAHGIPYIEIGNGLYPSKFTAQQYGISSDALRKLYLSGLNADGAVLHANATMVNAALSSGRVVHVTAANGTDVTFDVNADRRMTNEGVITPEMRAQRRSAIYVGLPTGDVIFSPVPGSANGKVVFDPLFFNNAEIDGLTMTFAQGKLIGMTATKGLDDIEKYYTAADAGKDVFTYADIGINPGVTPIPGSKMTVFMPAGMISLGIGNDIFLGGTDASGFSFGSSIGNATALVDGKPLIVHGKLLR